MLTAEQIDAITQLLQPLRWWTDPHTEGTELIPESGPVLFVGNHTLGGLFDVPVMFLELWRTRRIYPRALGHNIHFKIPVWGDLLTRFGVVRGTRDNCAQLMEQGEHILVFPGGGREVAKRRGEKYRLIWKERLGFVRMAIRHRCPIVPFSAIGVEDALDIRFDADDFQKSPLGALLRFLSIEIPDDIMVPLFTGLGPTPIPRPERYYFQFCEPIATAQFDGDDSDDAVCRELRDRVRSAVESGIQHLKTIQQADPQRSLSGRLAKR